MASNQMGKKTKTRSKLSQMQKDKHVWTFRKNVISKIHMCTINLWDDSKCQKYVLEQWAKIKISTEIRVLQQLEDSVTHMHKQKWRLHQQTSMWSPKHQQNSPPSIIHCLATNQRHVLWIVDFLVVSKLWYQNDDSDSWLPCSIISTEIGLFTHNTLLTAQWQNHQYVI